MHSLPFSATYPMHLFDAHPPPKLNVDFNSSETSCFAVSAKIPHAKQRDFEKKGLGNKNWKILQQEIKSPLLVTHVVSENTKAQNQGNLVKDEAREVQYHTNNEYADAKWKSFGRTNHSTRRPVGSIPVRPASASVRHNTLREYHWDLSHLQCASIVRLDSSDVSAFRSQRLISVWPTHVSPCPQHVESQFHTWPMLLSFSVVSGHFQKTPAHFALQIGTSDEWLPSPYEYMAIRAVSPALAKVQNSRVRAFYSQEIALSSLHADQ